MNEKIANQIAEMKKQTIGVEVEMNNITREQAAKLTADFFGTGRYKNTASINGYYTWCYIQNQGQQERECATDCYTCCGYVCRAFR